MWLVLASAGKSAARTDDRRTACKKIFGERQKMDHIEYIIISTTPMINQILSAFAPFFVSKTIHYSKNWHIKS